MEKYIWIVGIILSAIIAATTVRAEDFDGTRPLLVSIIRVVECESNSDCREVTPGKVNLPQFLKIDFNKKTIRPAPADEGTPATVIERQEVVDGKLILQGAEDGYEKMRDGLGWTMAIAKETGQVVMTASGDQVAFVVFGAALPQ